ncbi:hypothetical protein MHYP_G00101740 [Metynnis hypsauchen]
MEKLLEEPVKTFPSAESEAEAVRGLMEVVLEDAETHSATSEKEVKMMMLTDAAEAEAIKAPIDISLDENEEEHLGHLVSSDDVLKSISELLEVLFEDAISAGVQPLAENEMILKGATETKGDAEASDSFMNISVKEEKEEDLDEPLDNLVSITVDETDSELLDIQLENPASVQPLEYEAMKLMEAAEVAAEASNNVKCTCLEGTGDKPLEKHLVKEEKEEDLDEPLDNLVSITGDETDSELLDIQLENPASVQPLEYEAMKLMEAAEVAAEAANNVKCTCLEGTGDKPLEKHLGHLVSSDDVLKSISELLEVLFEDAISAGVQPLAENELILKGAAETKGDAEASDSLMNISVKEEKEEDLDEPLDNLVSITVDETDIISELLDIQLEKPASVQPLEYEAEMMMEVFAAQVAKHDLTFLATKAPKELLFTPLEVIEEESEEEPENKPLAEMDGKERDPPEEPETRKKKRRRGTRGKGRKINYNKDKNDSTSVSGNRGRAEGVRGQHHQEKRKTPPETPRPKTDSQRITDKHDRRQRTQQVLVTQRSSEQDTDESNAVPYTMTFYRTGWKGRSRTEGSRVECTPPQTDTNADGGREKRGGKPRPKKPHWYERDNRVQRPRETRSETPTHH